ncbi:exodeoxyribonuclease VII large subunit [Prevotella sp. P6B4]|uniref:exodeoxyribonuclease VII large subunit n=1 Tax=Prevotella sp. P6B4 TaxID=1410614 RepID=UPI0018CC424A|nr:exodeoxyribonuclease VII large subunit [Prevotella sp. P6B4]
MKDEGDGGFELTIKIALNQRNELTNDNLVDVAGTIERSLSPQGYIQITLVVSRVNIVQHQVVTELEMKQSELWKIKSQKFKNVDKTIEDVLYKKARPTIALVLPTGSIALSDFDTAKRAASSHFDFREYRVTFSKGMELATMLKQIDAINFTAIALVRGGGSGLEALDDLNVLEAVTNLKTPFISAIGHEDEKIFIKRIADKTVISPTDLGNYFREVIERVDKYLNDSLAHAREQVRKEFQAQIDKQTKQNQDLNKQLTELKKSYDEGQKIHKKQIEDANKLNTELQKKVAAITKTSEDGQKLMKKQLKDANKQNTDLQKKLGEQTNSINKNNAALAKMNETITKLTTENTETNKKLTNANSEISELKRQLAESGGISKGVFFTVLLIAIVIIVILLASR